MPQTTPNPSTEKLVVRTARAVVTLSLAWAAACYFCDFFPLAYGNMLRAAGYLPPTAWFILSLTILYSKAAKDFVGRIYECFITPLATRIASDATAGLLESPRFLTIPEIVCCAVISVVVVASDIHLSLKYGLLSGPPVYDGLGYMMDALRVYLGLSHVQNLFTGYGYSGYGPCAWMWDALMIASYHLFGDGVWQASTARYWPTLVFLINVAWVMKRRTGAAQTWAVVIASALVPILSPCVRALAWSKVLGPNVGGYTWYMDDLRPDFLNSTLLMSSVCLALETAKRPATAAFALSGLAAGLALFVKVSAAPGTAIVFGLAMILALWLGRKHFTLSLSVTLIASAVFLFCAWIWQDDGGYKWMQAYLGAAFRHPEIWSIQNYSPLHSASLYADMMWCELGPAETILVIIAIGFIALQIIRRRLKPSEELPFSYAGIGAVFFVSLCFVKSLNFFLGYTAFMLFWVAAVCVIVERPLKGLKPLTVGVGSVAYCLITVLAAELTLNHMPQSAQDGRIALSALGDISKYIGTNFKQSDIIVCESAYGSPAMYYSLQLMSAQPTSKATHYYPFCMPIVENSQGKDLKLLLESSSAVIVFEQPASLCANCPGYSPQVYWPEYDEIKQIVSVPNSRFRKVKSYLIPVEIPNGNRQARRVFLNLDVYINKEPLRGAGQHQKPKDFIVPTMRS